MHGVIFFSTGGKTFVAIPGAGLAQFRDALSSLLDDHASGGGVGVGGGGGGALRSVRASYSQA